jgi:hypothetical protein
MDTAVPGGSDRQIWMLFVMCIPLLAIISMVICPLCGAGAYQAAVFGYIHEIGLGVTGFVLFFCGFHAFRERWLVQNTPTATVRSVALGFAELKGVAAPKCLLRSRVTLAECVFFRFVIEKEKRGARGRRYWDVVDEGCSTNYFYIDDGTGRMLVDPLNAELVLSVDYRHEETKDGSRMRYTEWYLRPGDPAYVLGTVRPFRDAVQDRADRLREKLRELKAASARLAQFDTSKNGQIDADEWDRARAATEQALLEEELQNNAPADGDDVMIAKGEAETTMLIADCAEREVTRKLLLQSMGFVIGGGALVMAMTASLLARAGLLTIVPAIPWETMYHYL